MNRVDAIRIRKRINVTLDPLSIARFREMKAQSGIACLSKFLDVLINEAYERRRGESNGQATAQASRFR